LAREWGNGERAGMWNWYVCEFGMLECWNSGGCAQLGNLYILTIVVVVMDDSNLRCYKGLFRISQISAGFRVIRCDYDKISR